MQCDPGHFVELRPWWRNPPLALMEIRERACTTVLLYCHIKDEKVTVEGTILPLSCRLKKLA